MAVIDLNCIRECLAELKKRREEPAPEGWQFEGGQVKMNTEENQIQIFFDDKARCGYESEKAGNLGLEQPLLFSHLPSLSAVYAKNSRFQLVKTAVL